MSTALLWFRNDLRLHDNPALYHACKNHEKVILIYIFEENKKNILGTAKSWWLHHSLNALNKNLLKKNAKLIINKGNSLDVILELIQNYNIEAVYWNRRYDIDGIKQDKKIKAQLLSGNITARSFNANFLIEPWDILNNQNSFFKVFTPFFKKYISICNTKNFDTRSTPKVINTIDIESIKLSELNLLIDKLDWQNKFKNYWQPGEKMALKQLDNFIDSKLEFYKLNRDIPFEDYTSKLSPYLSLGEISPKFIWNKLQDIKSTGDYNHIDIEKYQAQIIWREFSNYLLYHFPELPNKNFNEKFNNFRWNNEQSKLNLWKKGLTGYPLIDAGMRELWETGYMHNRVRMVVASFLIKDLLIDWRIGAAWFEETLLDADIANNSASWQWVAGSGVDSAPYFRIFNPILQSEKFDSKGLYIRKWCKELDKLDNKFIHKPWQAPKEELKQAGVVLGETYPFPIIEHDKARKRALELYKLL